MAMQAQTAASGNKEKFGLVFSGGGIFFAIHAGVMQVASQWLDDDNRPWLERFRSVVGTSAGALYGALYAAGYSPTHITVLAEIMSLPPVGPSLFDLNVPGAAATLLRHDASYFRGALRGARLLSLLETILSRAVRDELTTGQYEHVENLDAAGRRALAQLVHQRWNERDAKPRDPDYYKGLLSFDDVAQRGIELFLIGVNAYNGQKTVFCRLNPNESQWKEEDDKIYESDKPNYINQKDISSDYRRYANRTYRKFDHELYGKQFPVAHAVRASISIPVIFEPHLVRHVGQEANSQRKDYDVFFDGGVDDNFSLHVITDPNYGKCDKVLGVYLGNLGLRLPDPSVVRDVTRILMQAPFYIIDANMDLQILENKHATGAVFPQQITIVNALSQVQADLQDTSKVPALIQDGGKMARDFWCSIHGKNVDEYPAQGDVHVDLTRMFAKPDGPRIFLSQGARAGSEAYKAFAAKKRGNEPILADPTLGDAIFGAIPPIGFSPNGSKAPKLWRAFYFLFFFALCGLLSLILGLVEGATGAITIFRTQWFSAASNEWVWLVLEAIATVVLILVVRIIAYAVWVNAQSKDTP